MTALELDPDDVILAAAKAQDTALYIDPKQVAPRLGKEGEPPAVAEVENALAHLAMAGYVEAGSSINAGTSEPVSGYTLTEKGSLRVAEIERERGIRLR